MITKDSLVKEIVVPNCVLYYGQDTYGNLVQWLVPFGEDPLSVAIKNIEHFDSKWPIESGLVVYAGTIRNALGINFGIW